jgi:hypothetical protein
MRKLDRLRAWESAEGRGIFQIPAVKIEIVFKLVPSVFQWKDNSRAIRNNILKRLKHEEYNLLGCNTL